MTGMPILPRFESALRRPRPRRLNARPAPPADLHSAWLHRSRLPSWVSDCAAAVRALELLGPLHWERFPERDLLRDWGQPTIPYAACCGALLIKLNEHLVSMTQLHRYLVEHPALIWLLHFPLAPTPQESLPDPRHFCRMAHQLPQIAAQALLGDSVALILAELAALGVPEVGQCISLDTKHILAWVKENNPKLCLADRYDKTRQPHGYPDCRLGCKRKHNRQLPAPLTPTTNPVPAAALQIGEYYWGYASGVVVTQVPGWGEFVLAEMTQPFDAPDVSYFFPLMAQTQARLGFRPRWGAFDAAFDAFYVYEYFHRPEDPFAFAAVPFSGRGGGDREPRRFSPEGLPLCRAGLPMPLKFAFTDRTTTRVEHQRGKYVCPLHFARPHDPAPCPVSDPRWAAKDGCTSMMPTSVGARIRHQLDRDSALYQAVYRQRSAVERINGQAVALGIERPHLRNGAAIANLNTLIYTLINLRFLQRLRQPVEA